MITPHLFAALSPDILKLRKKIRQPDFVQPMLATLTNSYFSSNDWLYEHKFDGERCLVFKKNGRVGRYKGLRDDKAAQDVVKETPKAIVIGHY